LQKLPERLHLLLTGFLSDNTLDIVKKKMYNNSNKLEKRLHMKTKNSFRTVGVYTENEYLFQKIALELSGIAEAVLLTREDERKCDSYLVDADNPAFSQVSGIRMKREGADITLPFRIGSLASFFEDENNAFVEIIPSSKSARVGQRTVRLTELEYSLFNLLISAKGAYVSREKILDTVWSSKADKGIINVYIHYLREKLEADGEKIILSSRNYGYKINEKYLGGDADA